MTTTDKAFTGSIPALYDRYLGPLLFVPYADDLSRRVAAASPQRVLETAAGTGIVTEQLVRRLPATTSIVCTDLNQAMLDVASAKVPAANVAWKACDATILPFPAEDFDVVACQFGVMFFPDKPAAFGEARRVLRAGGRLIFNVWNKLSSSPLPLAVAEAVAAQFPSDPPNFLARTPYGYFDIGAIRQSLSAAGFIDVSAEIVTKPSRAASARDVAAGFCEGSPLRAEIEARAAGRLAAITEAATAAVAKRFGNGPIESTMQAIVIEARI
jgi:SAM-dependent methyltransferase